MLRVISFKNVWFSNTKVIRFLSNAAHDPTNVTRGNFNRLNKQHVNYFRSLLGDGGIITDSEDVKKYNNDFFSYVQGKSELILRPKTTDDVSKILHYCNENLLAVCPQGGNTGIVGGGIAIFDEIVLSMEHMNKIIEINDSSGVIVCEAGCILENLNDKLSDKGFMMPVDLAAKSSCHIGGNVATNAGGTKLLRYGNLHGNVLGLKVVKANGEILNCLNTCKKDNTGYALKNLFIGSEGTLGVITEVALQCPPKPKSFGVAILGLDKFENVIRTFKSAKQNLGEILSAFEVLDSDTSDLIEENLGIRFPIESYPFYILMEVSECDDENHSELKLLKFLESALENDYIINGTVTSDPGKIQSIWSVRERVSEAIAKASNICIYDVSVPLQHYYDVVEEMRDYLGDKPQRVFGFGHIGDDNLHLQVQYKETIPQSKQYVENFLLERVKHYKGSISAEHGIGFLKRRQLPLVKEKAVMKAMQDLKNLMDPKGILNPYKTIYSA